MPLGSLSTTIQEPTSRCGLSERVAKFSTFRGTHYRRCRRGVPERLFVQVRDQTAPILTSLAVGGGNGGGKDYIWSGYGELTIPVLGGKFAVPGARSLQVILAERFDNYSTSGDAWKPKISVLFEPFDDLTFRASYSEGFRAPFVTELFAGELIGFPSLVDPVTGK